MKNFSQSLLAAAIIAPIYVVPVQAEPMLEEVVVSARKRAESLEDSPISVKAFTEDAIRQAGIQNASGFCQSDSQCHIGSNTKCGQLLPQYSWRPLRPATVR